MDQARACGTFKLGDQITSDVTVRLINRDGRPELFPCHLFILTKKCKFFANWLSQHPSYPITESSNCIEVHCLGSEYDHYVKLLKLIYLPEELVSDSWDSVKSALGVLQASIALQCETITKSCIRYLEAVPWDEKEEEEILKVVPTLGPEAMPIVARMQPVDTNATKNVFISAIRFATTIESSFPPFADELKTSAQEQVEYMLLEDEETPLIALDEDVKYEARSGLAKMFTTFEKGLSLLPSEYDQSPEVAEQRVVQNLLDLEWMCNILPKMEMMKDFVSTWACISDHVLAIVQDEKFSSGLWAVKAKLIEVTGKALDAIGYGNVVLPAPSRVQFLKTWLPYIRNLKPLLDSKNADDEAFPYKMDGDLCQNIEGAITSLVLALPSSHQADILMDWMQRTEQLKYPDLSEAFEVWCYRTKSAKRRLLVGFNGIHNPTITF
ncbi:BTB/POZ domain-containing protein At3g05675-like [Phoenix dactylifera]|uniref:BTB/POZ domain-containing protein At3g05675-like n=1 Tax=Phoenix dactylifera TaxID=42345 RepID=A0A8B7BEB7_PHODC|nr:BTB/POZ domain-containing protein At3g05675-like [Phoenix dactylifera]XP_008775084.2 BTB/POZ domain-containing protein At3g05675-like [Phoenix dactylifera]